MNFDETYLKCFDIVYRFCFARNGGNQYSAEEATKKAMDFMAQKWEMVQSYDRKTFYFWLYSVAKMKMLAIFPKKYRGEQLVKNQFSRLNHKFKNRNIIIK